MPMEVAHDHGGRRDQDPPAALHSRGAPDPAGSIYVDERRGRYSHMAKAPGLGS